MSIGSTTANTMTKTVYAQSNSVAQEGSGDDAKQGIGQLQESNQDNQVVSGDSSILSGSNLQCQEQDGLKALEQMCNTSTSEGLGDFFDRHLEVRVTTINTTESYQMKIVTYDEKFNPIDETTHEIMGNSVIERPVSKDAYAYSLTVSTNGQSFGVVGSEFFGGDRILHCTLGLNGVSVCSPSHLSSYTVYTGVFITLAPL